MEEDTSCMSPLAKLEASQDDLHAACTLCAAKYHMLDTASGVCSWKLPKPSHSVALQQTFMCTLQLRQYFRI